MKQLVFTVTNDLLYDQRMIRICSSLHNAGYKILLIGRSHKNTQPIVPQLFRQKRIRCFFQKGKWLYIEYNIKLFFYLLWQPMHLVCAIDLDTILPCYLVSKLRRKKRVYDAHELFCEMKEVVSRPAVYKIWKWVERSTVPHFSNGYTVNEYISHILQKEYGVQYAVIRNMPLLQDNCAAAEANQPFVLYQGAVNEGRSFETLIPAFQWIDVPLWICGDGNFLQQAMALAQQYGLQQKVIFKGKILPAALKKITPQATLGITLFEHNGLNNYYSLANRFFDYMHAGVPQLCVAYPAYEAINKQYKVAILINNLSPASIAQAINETLADKVLLHQMHENCLQARAVLNWQMEEKKLIHFYHQIFQR